MAVTMSVATVRAITIDWITAGNSGNAADMIASGSYGAVAYDYRIMPFEFTAFQYVSFLNAIDPSGSNSNAVYRSSDMSTHTRGGFHEQPFGRSPPGFAHRRKRDHCRAASADRGACGRT
jgi:hypothetical protein